MRSGNVARCSTSRRWMHWIRVAAGELRSRLQNACGPSARRLYEDIRRTVARRRGYLSLECKETLLAELALPESDDDE